MLLKVKSKECIVSYYLLSNHGFKFQNSLCNGCDVLAMLCLNIIIITVKGVDYSFIIHDIGKSESIHVLKNYVLDDLVYI